MAQEQIEQLIAEVGPGVVVEALSEVLTEERMARLEEVLAARIESVTVVLENLYDPHNGAAVLRSVEAFGLADVHAIEAASRFSASSAITIGAHQWLSVHRHDSLQSCVAGLKERGFRICATVPGAERSFEDLDPALPRALLFGNEHEGLTEAAVALCDEVVSIPMWGFTQSFNLSVSAALALAGVVPKRRKHLKGQGDLPESRKAFERARWYARGVRGAPDIIRRYVSDSTQNRRVSGDASEPKS